MSPDLISHRRRNRLRTAQRSKYAPRCHFNIVIGYTRIVDVLPGARNALHTADPCITQRRSRSRTLQTRASHSADPGVAHCRPRRRTLQTQASHTADPGVAHCRPRRRTLQTRASHTADPGVKHCRPERRTLECTPERRTLHTRAQTKSPISVRNSAVHKRLGVQACLEYKPVSSNQSRCTKFQHKQNTKHAKGRSQEKGSKIWNIILCYY